MKLLKRILVATDFSKTSDNVIQNAIEMAKIFGSEIALVYVLPEDVGSQKASDLLKEFATNQLTTLNKQIENLGVSTLKPHLEVGDFSEKIVEVADQINANFVFAGAGEKLEDDQVKLGSNAKKIIKTSTKPVFIVKDNTKLSINKILCPVDFSLESKRSLKNAITLAHKFSATLVILSVYETSQLLPIKEFIQIEEDSEHLKESCKNNLENFLRDVNLTGLDVKKEVIAGKPSTEILNAINRHEIDLLLMGTTGKTGLTKILLGSVTDTVINEIPCSFITIKKEDAIIIELEENLRTIDFHYNTATQLFEDGFFNESISEYKKCLELSFTHLPAMQGLCKVYKKLGDQANVDKFKSMIKRVLEKMNYEKIEAEIRKLKS